MKTLIILIVNKKLKFENLKLKLKVKFGENFVMSVLFNDVLFIAAIFLTVGQLDLKKPIICKECVHLFSIQHINTSKI